MGNADRPAFTLYEAAAIESAQNDVDKFFWEHLCAFQAPSPYAESTVRRSPTPPARKEPAKFLMVLADYAKNLFIAEGNLYQNGPQLQKWLEGLKQRVFDRTADMLGHLEEQGESRGLSIMHHGVTPEVMRAAVLEELDDLIAARLAPPLPSSPPLPPEIQVQMDAPSTDDDPATWSVLRSRVAAYTELKKLIEGPKTEIPEVLVRQALAEQFGVKPEEVTWKQIRSEVAGLLTYYPAICLIPSNPPPQTESDQAKTASQIEIERRSTLLREYKAATGDPSNKRIFEAHNSGIYKPEFARWRRGELPSSSATTQNFERFLREKKPPIPRKPKS